MSNFLELFKNWDDTVEFQAGAEIISENSAEADLYVILSGDVELSLRGKLLGKESTGGMIGEMAMLPSVAGSPSARAVTQVKLARLSREQLDRLITANPAFSRHALLSLANRLRAANAFISAQLKDKELGGRE